MSNTPVQKKSVGISPVWTLPIIALAICSWLLYQSYQNAGINITIYFNDATGITAGKTQVVSMGLPIGLVKKVEAELDSGRIKTTVEMDKVAEKVLVEDTVFWVVKPEVSAARISGLDTILSGSYIGIQPGDAHEKTLTYDGLSSPPPVAENSPGLHFFLEAKALQSIQEGSGIYYKNIQIGSVQTYNLQENSENHTSILISCYIKEKFAHLVKPESRFTNASGVSISGKLTNLKFRMESLSTLIMGGILLETPENAMNSTSVFSGHTFTLYEDLEEASFNLPMTLKLTSGEGVIEGVTKVIYRGLEAGYVHKVDFIDDNSETGAVIAHILLDERARIILKQGTRFWLAGPEISADGIKNLSTLISGPYITFHPGEGKYTDHFNILPEPPALKPLRPGKMFSLSTPDPVDLTAGSPVLYKGIKVGEVIDLTLQPNTADIMVTIFIYDHYLHFVSSHSIFWNTSGIKLNASMKGIDVESGSFSSILHGGISFTTPDILDKMNVSSPDEGYSFPLFTNRHEAYETIPAFRPEGVRFQISSNELNSISVDSPILYKKYEIGRILDYSLKGEKIIFDCLITPEYSSYLKPSSLFYNASGIKVSGSLEGISVQTGSLETIIAGGVGLYNPLKTKDTKAKKKKSYHLYDNFDAAVTHDHIELQVTFKKGDGLKIGSPIKFAGIVVGKVTDMDISNLPQISATVKISRDMEKYFRTGTRIWLASSEIALSRIRHLDTLIFGPFITFAPGQGELSREFTALSAPPEEKPVKNTDGLNLVLSSKSLGSLSVDAPVYYRQVQIGRITGYELDTSFKNVLIYVHIDFRYAPIIQENTKFWNASGTKIEGGLLSGITFQTESMESLIRGGIALATPESEKESSKNIVDGHQFILHDDCQPEWLDWDPDIVVLESKKKTVPLPSIE